MKEKLSETDSTHFEFMKIYTDDTRTTIRSGFFTLEDANYFYDKCWQRILSANGPHDRETVETFLKDWNKNDQLNWIEKK